MRFCPIEGNGIEQDDGFPPGVQVKVNTKFVTIPVSITIVLIFYIHIK